MTQPFDPEPEQIMAFVRWLMRDDVKRALAVCMTARHAPKAGDSKW
jgi:hypothetical protein